MLTEKWRPRGDIFLRKRRERPAQEISRQEILEPGFRPFD
jgi:hypothetical protein